MTLDALPQTYRRTNPRRYAYSNRRFKASLDVDRNGMVTRYGRQWRAVVS